ncbi:hypothetical protein IGB42_02788 [Andreprevotia sp. IGB-42]|uniref:DUF411 domain-containing protein n=1 Tax=Andreprevotia sp. IGB-42 TaxID=2497473 RepID=UPI00135B8569|nr:DUF411 domain-containing protein [Andreprevotia sp. IGB-42]KAF0812938.1 hypothetical protein IGB42_02788 [Andreprevotia sp. IGB-42]
MRISLITACLLLAAHTAMAAVPATVYKSPTCGCCQEYVSYLEKQGYTVTAINSDDMDGVKKRFGSTSLASCHTTLIGGYTIEGHVPVAAISKLLKDKPKIRGIAVPGMPANSPGMGPEVKGTLKVYELASNIDPTKPTAPKLFSVE